MINHIFSNGWFSLITPPNKKDLIRGVKRASVREDYKIKWDKDCKVKTQPLDEEELSSVLIPSIKLFLDQLDRDLSGLKVELTSIWRNIYKKGYYQEIHNHITVEGCNISAVLFLEDYHPKASHLYLYNKHGSDVDIKPNAGQIIFFPSHLLHGVTHHQLGSPRTTIAFNLKLSK